MCRYKIMKQKASGRPITGVYISIF
jgi:hypothetical protein